MSTPGDITLVDKDYDEVIEASGPFGGGTLLRLRDVGQSVDTDRIIVPTQRTYFDLEIQAVFSSTVTKRPERIQIELVRFKTNGKIDYTGKSQRCIVQPGTTTWADTIHVSEYVNDTDGAFGFTFEATRRDDGNVIAPIRIDVLVWDITNPKANMIHALGGWNVMSNGVVSDKPYLIP